MEKRCYNTQEAMEYLGVKRRFFETKLGPDLDGKGVPAGTSVVYERRDLDAAWEKYKIGAGSERSGFQEGEKETWSVQERRVFTERKKTPMRSIPGTKVSEFASVASRVLNRPRVT
jgi:hypothetical protein